MADNVAEFATLCSQHAKTPGRLGRQIDHVAHGQLRRCRQAVADILVALAHDLQIEGDHQRRTVCRLRTLDQIPDEGAVPHDIKLEPERFAGVFRDILDRTDRHGRQGEGNAESLRSLRCQDFTVGMLHAGQSCRGQRHGHRHRFAKHRHAGVALRHIDGDTLAELDGLKVRLIGIEGGFGPGSAFAIVVEHARHAALHLFTKIFYTGNNGHVPASFPIPESATAEARH